MENVVLVIHLILAVCLIGIVLMQRSEGGGLGIGGGGGVVTGRAAATALAKLTWIFAVAFLATSITLTILAAKKAGTQSVVDRVAAPAAEAPAAPAAPEAPAGSLLPPSTGDTPLVPPPVE